MLHLKKFWLRQAGKKHLLKIGADERINLDVPAVVAADTHEKKAALPHAQAAAKESTPNESTPV